MLLLAVLIGVIALAVVKSSFQSEAVGLIRISKEGFGGNGADYETYKLTQAELIRSAFICNAALRNSAAANCSWVKSRTNPAEDLREALQYSSVNRTEVIQLTLRMPDKQEAKILLDAVMNAYLESVRETAQQEPGNAMTSPKIEVIEEAQIVN